MCFSVNLKSQEYFSKLIDGLGYEESGCDHAINPLIRKDTIYSYVFGSNPSQGATKKGSFIAKYNLEGKLLETITLSTSTIEIRTKMIWDDEDILMLGRFDGARDSLQILRIKGSSVYLESTFYNPYWELHGTGTFFEFIKFKDKYVIAHSAFEGILTPSGVNKACLTWLNDDFTVDTLIKLDYPFAEIIAGGVVEEDNLQFILFYNTAKFEPRQRYYGYISLDYTKRVTHEFFVEHLKYEDRQSYRIPWRLQRSGLVFEDGFKFFILDEINTGGVLNRIFAIDARDSLYEICRENIYLISNMQKCQNGDFLLISYSRRRYINALSPPIVPTNYHSALLSRFDRNGRYKYRTSFLYFSKMDTSLNYGLLPNLVELEDNSIVLFGMSRDRNSYNSDGYLLDSVWMVKTDAEGCISKDRCNEIQAANPPDYIFSYDQINSSRKEWYVENQSTGELHREYLSEDSFTPGILPHRQDVIQYTRNLITQYQTAEGQKQDTTLIYWMDEGKVYVERSRDLWHPDWADSTDLLYDYSLKVGDVFTLPLGHGEAEVVSVDSITLLPGYRRKRITLRHLTRLYRERYGPLVWIEGIGSPAGIRYYRDWSGNQKYKLSCFYDHGELRYTATEGSQCAASTLIEPLFPAIAPLCKGATAPILPTTSDNDTPISGTWVPAEIDTRVAGTYKFVFHPWPGQHADTASMIVEVTAPIDPIFPAFGPYALEADPVILPEESRNGVTGSWEPPVVYTDGVGVFTHLFVPDAGQCALEKSVDIYVWEGMEITDMDASAVWISEKWGENNQWPECEVYKDVVKVVKDTIIGPRYCRVIGTSYNKKYLPESELIVFQKEGRMYFYEDESWWLIYDFNAKVGDTVRYNLPRNYMCYSLFGGECITGPYHHLYENNPFLYYIRRIDTIYTAEGVPLRKYDTDGLNVGAAYMGDMIENMGSIDGLFGITINFALPECSLPKVLCYNDDDISIKLAGEECDRLTSITEAEQISVLIYPNPGTDELLLKSDVSARLRYKIYHITGQLMSEGELHGVDRINTREWTAGMYIIHIGDDYGSTAQYKWLKIR